VEDFAFVTVLYRIENLDKGLLDERSIAMKMTPSCDCDEQVSTAAEIEHNEDVLSVREVSMYGQNVGMTRDLEET
jgi:hypothetical protein